MLALDTKPRSIARPWCAAVVLTLLAIVSMVCSTPVLASPAAYEGAAATGESVFFTTTEKMVPGDTDNKRDVYQRFYSPDPGIESFVTREVSTGPVGGNDAYDVSFAGASSSGFRVFFMTDEALVAEDEDLSADVYVRNLNTGATVLVSAADPLCSVPKCGNAAHPISFDSASSDGTRVVFSTAEALNDEDQDSAEDVYVRDLQGGETTLVSEAASSCSAPNCGDGATPASFEDASADALTIAFSSGEALSDEDVDPDEDIYVRDVQGGDTDLVSLAGNCPSPLGPGECTPIFEEISGDGSHVFFETGEQVAPGQDTDSRQDVYGWSGAAPILLSTRAGGGNGGFDATYQGTSADGSVAFFETDEPLSALDTDTVKDVYRRSGIETVLVSTGPTDANPGSPASFEKTAPDGSTVAFTSEQPLTDGDLDSSRDVYVRDVGTDSTTLISVAEVGCTGTCGTDEEDASFAGASGDVSAVFFETAESLVAADTDASDDVYERAAGDTKLVSTGPMSKNGISNPHLEDVSVDAVHAFFITEEKLTPDDPDGETDVYDRSKGETLLVSARNPADLVLGPAVPLLTGTNPASPNPSTEPRVLGEADVGTSIKLYATFDCSGTPVATGTAAQLELPGIPVKVGAGSTTSFHATATLFNDTSACSTVAVTYTQAAESGGGGEGGGGGPGGGGGSGGGAGSGGTAGGAQPSGGSHPGAGGQHSAPHTRITFAPATKTRQRRPTFQFVDSTGQQDTRFVCAVDRGPWRACSSPTKLKKLRRGRHVFKVKGVNSGLWEPAPAARSFKVVSR